VKEINTLARYGVMLLLINMTIQTCSIADSLQRIANSPRVVCR
jgi:hypothetical protein